MTVWKGLPLVRASESTLGLEFRGFRVLSIQARAPKSGSGNTTCSKKFEFGHALNEI